MGKPNTEAWVDGIKAILTDYETGSASAIRRELALRLTNDVNTNMVPSDLTRFLTWMVGQGMITVGDDQKYKLKTEVKDAQSGKSPDGVRSDGKVQRSSK